jgi:hypothetical protein
MRPKYLNYVLVIGLSFLMACGGYKQLKPKPEVSPREAGYLKLQKGDKIFKLKKGKKYYMEFPAPAQEDFYLVLRGNDLSLLSSHLTRQFTRGKGDIKMRDESALDDDVNVYKPDRLVPVYYWVIEDVSQTVELPLDYRYVPIWRYRFETKSAEFQLTLARNKVDRQTYEAPGVSLRADDVNFERELSATREKTNNLKALEGALLEIEAIFPPNILNSDDPAYLDYIGFKNELKSELKFQEDYMQMLTVFKLEKDSRSDPAAFAQAVPAFYDFFQNKANYSGTVLREAREVIGIRLPELAPYLENVFRTKNDITPVDFPVEKAETLYAECNKQPEARFKAIANAVEAFNRNAGELEAAKQQYNDIMDRVNSVGTWPEDTFFPELQVEMSNIAASLPRFSGAAYGKFISNNCVSQLQRETTSFNQKARQTQQDFKTASVIVPEINRFRNQGNYSEVIRMLKLNQVGFLTDIYVNLDQRSLEQQQSAINTALESGNRAAAEQRIRALYEDRNFINYDAIAYKKNQIVKSAEERLVSTVEQESQKRINAFIELKKEAYGDVDSLYAGEAFKPVYELTFSSGGPNVLEQHKKRIQDYLDSFKYDKFPRMSIEGIYKDFSRDPRNEGVAKARAIIAHGKYYKGSDRKIKNLVAECDPMIPKWITKPKEYRRVYVVPVNQTQQAGNEYVFRLNIQIPSDAKFPVFDVNIKLPREVASRAGQTRWYDSITMNGQVLKNEGRFTITAPTASNDYECQLSPVQMFKDRDNILEVKFKHSAFKVLEVSVMCQRPIIKKN